MRTRIKLHQHVKLVFTIGERYNRRLKPFNCCLSRTCENRLNQQWTNIGSTMYQRWITDEQRYYMICHVHKNCTACSTKFLSRIRACRLYQRWINDGSKMYRWHLHCLFLMTRCENSHNHPWERETATNKHKQINATIITEIVRERANPFSWRNWTPLFGGIVHLFMDHWSLGTTFLSS